MPKKTAITSPGDLNPHGSFEYEPQEAIDQGYKEGFAYALSWTPGRPIPAAVNSSVGVGHKYNAEYVQGYKEGYADGMAENKTASKKTARRTAGIGPDIREGRECDPSVILQQIGSMNVMAISGGRSSAVYDSSGHPVGVSLPVSNGYSVVVYLDFSDTYVVERCFRDKVKGSLDYVYSDQVGEIAYRASCFHDDFGGHEASRKKNTKSTRRKSAANGSDWEKGYWDSFNGEWVNGLNIGWDEAYNGNSEYGDGFNAGSDAYEIVNGTRPPWAYDEDNLIHPDGTSYQSGWNTASKRKRTNRRRATRRRTASEWNRDLSELDQTISDPQWWEEGGPGRGAADVSSVPTPGAANSYPQPSNPDMDTAISDEAPEEWPGQEVDGQGAEDITTDNADIDLEKVEAFRRRILSGLRRERQRRSQSREAAFSDVRAKAREIFTSGGVSVDYIDADTIVGNVQSPNGKNYNSEIVFSGGTRKVYVWVCSCDWGYWRNQGDGYGSAGNMSPQKYEGRMCSHTLALYYQWCSAKGYSVENPPGLEASSSRRPSRRRKGRGA